MFDLVVEDAIDSDMLIDLDRPLVEFAPASRHRRADVFTIRDACEGVQIFGAVGSGKTSGSGSALAHAYLANGFGGLVCCAKPEERELWEEYARATGRTDDLVIFGEDRGYFYDFLDHELRRLGQGGGMTENLVNLFSVVTEIVEAKPDAGGGEAFWPRAMQEMLRNAIDLLSLAQGTLSIEDLVRFVSSAPQTRAQVPDLAWINQSFCAQICLQAQANAQSDRERHDFTVSTEYWLRGWPEKDIELRTNVLATFTSVADILNHGLAWELMASGNVHPTNLVPEATYLTGAIIIVDLPIQKYGHTGRVMQGIWKYMWQRSVLRRNPDVHPLPVFLWADESQNFLSSFDFEYQTVARSARACTVMLTQNISNMYAVLGAHGREHANALLGSLSTKIFHSNADEPTNQYAANLIAQDWRSMATIGANTGDKYQSQSAGFSEAMHYRVAPVEFTWLKMGGPKNQRIVQAIIHKSGHTWNSTDDTYLRTSFRQPQQKPK